jgi:hypothetical protein
VVAGARAEDVAQFIVSPAEPGGCSGLNRMTRLGMPVSPRIA